MRLRWSQPASEDLCAIYEFIAQENPVAAAETVEMLVRAAERLASYPQLGHKGAAGTRRMVHPPWIIVYRIIDDVVNVEAVFHGSRKVG